MVKALLVYIHTDSLRAEPEVVMDLLVLANQVFNHFHCTSIVAVQLTSN